LALQGHDILCQAKSGMGKTAVFVISILNQIVPDGENYEPHQAIITCHTRELAHQIFKDFKRLGNSVPIQAATSRSPIFVSDAILEESHSKKIKPNLKIPLKLLISSFPHQVVCTIWPNTS
jgi:ATP-dependent RNA helicase UAP56/SUB2